MPNFTREQIDAINQNVSIADILEYAGVEIAQNGQVFCPFHENYDTKAAHVYESTNRLHCFGECGRAFYPFDVMVRLLRWDYARIKSYLPDDFTPSRPERHERGNPHPYRFPIVDQQTFNEFDTTGKLVPFLTMLARYWEAKDDERIQCVDL